MDVKARVTWLAATVESRTRCAMPIPDPTEGSGDEDSGDVRLISSVLMDAALCVDCIMQKTSLPARRVYVALVTIAQGLNLDSDRSLCSDCMITKHVYKLR